MTYRNDPPLGIEPIVEVWFPGFIDPMRCKIIGYTHRRLHLCYLDDYVNLDWGEWIDYSIIRKLVFVSKAEEILFNLENDINILLLINRRE